MNRAEVAHLYRVNADGTIVSPGMFEGQPAYVVHFFELSLGGDAEDERHTAVGGVWWQFRVQPEDIEDWPELAGREEVRVYCDPNGSVYEVEWEPDQENEICPHCELIGEEN